ncbi:FtsW/RodA/SpoVE family cell cycle protein [Candidatus Nesciobacter abundans]|uniref:Probable peptidoglycan glycosyltransferase FtsW n=1 Tax=Candidatus Nesciobacter abundans TaxID=2601668 RepID=A0A5C0UHS1_9PROT|nr:FtsW/RodA/SpoVE family cell cycle protein [Candidatus Nesciobacter abundans]QEK39113.1 hypothetical protein FZC36_01520 [Candidatus Nesciobacter abundans]
MIKKLEIMFRRLDLRTFFPFVMFFLISTFFMAAYIPWNISIFRHIIIWVVGFFLINFITKKGYDSYIEISRILFFISVFLIIFTFFKGTVTKGSKRWISIAGLSIQPSELLKSSCIAICANYIYENNLKHFFLSYFVSFILLITQPDFGSTLLLGSVMIIQLLYSDFKKEKLYPLFWLGLVFCIFVIIYFPHVRIRIKNFFLGNENILEGGYQGFRSVQAIKNGGLLGLGLGKGVFKKYIPDAYSDFIFSVIAEELGMVGCFLILYCFGYIVLSNVRKSKILKPYPEYYLILSSVFVIFIQAWINMASALWIIPTKGITLPFISHGGTSLLISFWTIIPIFISNKKYKKAKLSQCFGMECS